jgi:imidazolonepropionase-like amidohydrolase
MLDHFLSILTTITVATACGVPSHLAGKNLVKTAITNVHVWDGFKFGPESTVVFINGTLSNANPANATTIDGNGGFLIPGLIDGHFHVGDCSNLGAMRQYGVTTGLDMGTYPYSSLNACKASGLTDVRGSGAAGTVNGTNISKFPGFPSDSFIPNPDAGRKFVANRLAEGADYIKVFLDPLGPDVDTLAAVVQAAHESGKQVIAHSASYVSFSEAEQAKVDIPCHTPLDRVLDAPSIANLSMNQQSVVPTLIMMQSIVNNTHAPYSAYLDYAQGSVTAMYKGKIPIVVGTDANDFPYTPANPPFGVSMHEELQLLVDAGISPVDAIRGATSIAASTFRLYDRGSIRPGLRADLVLLSSDPTIDIRNTMSIQKVWIEGLEFDPSL